jgi:tRNA threonylcarbamoyladenosine biosynthesis protein TsaE
VSAAVRSSAPDGRRLALDDGTTGVLLDRPPWSWLVHDLSGPSPDRWLEQAERWAAEQGVLDLRTAEPLPGTDPLADGTAERVRVVPQELAGSEATRQLGRRVAPALRPGDLLVLSGPLGAGKTTFTQGLGEALGVRGRVTSPTFVLARVHRGPLPLVHVDAYRLREPGTASLDLDDLDLDAALEDAVTVVEWGDGVVEHLTASRLDVRLDRSRGSDPLDDEVAADGRRARVRCAGPRWAVLPAPDTAGPG